MGLKDYRIDGTDKFCLRDMETGAGKEKENKDELLAKTAENLDKMAEYQEKLYADGREGLIFVLQARDAAGKDSTVKHVMSGLNPAGVTVCSFKAPTSTELAHDYLWRVNESLPQRGRIAIFNRSHYEDVLVARVHRLDRVYHMAERCRTEDFFEKRLRQIRHYEEYLYDNSYRVVKVFLNVSKDEQKKRFLERLQTPDKNWKWNDGDIKERALWDEYTKAYQQAIEATATKTSPWYVIPADDKWYTRYLVSKLMLETLKDMEPQYPRLSEEEKKALPEFEAQLKNEG